MNVTFITGNQAKADLFAKYMGHEIKHHKLDLEEIQSLELEDIVDHKVRQAYTATEGPVLVEDVALSLSALGGLPGPFVKWFEKTIGLEGICRLLDNYSDRSAVVSVCFAYYDGDRLEFFRGEVEGRISETVKSGPGGFGWNPIFIPNSSNKTYAEMSEDEQNKKGLRATTVYPMIKRFLDDIDKK
jgi:inosine triphosphate pyrophosphatase